jgi:transposase
MPNRFRLQPKGSDREDEAAAAVEEHSMRLVVAKLSRAKQGFVLLPRLWVSERIFAWVARFRRSS